MKTAVAVLLVALALTSAAAAEEQSFEYRVVYLPGTAAQGLRPNLEPLDGGAFVDVLKTDALRELARQGWEVVSVVGDSGADHAVYLRRRISPP